MFITKQPNSLHDQDISSVKSIIKSKFNFGCESRIQAGSLDKQNAFVWFTMYYVCSSSQKTAINVAKHSFQYRTTRSSTDVQAGKITQAVRGNCAVIHGNYIMKRTSPRKSILPSGYLKVVSARSPAVSFLKPNSLPENPPCCHGVRTLDCNFY